MNLISLLILPAVIGLEGLEKDNPGANGFRFVIAGVALVVLIGAIAFSKRKAEAMDAGVEPASGAAPVPVHAVSDGDPPLKLAQDALDRWIMDLGDEDAALRTQLREAKSRLGATRVE